MTYILFFKMAEFKGRVFFDIFFLHSFNFSIARAFENCKYRVCQFFFLARISQFLNFFEHFFKR